MAEPVNESKRQERRGDRPPAVPGWVKVSGLVAFVVVVALLVIMLLSGGEHGPGLHTRAGDAPSRFLFMEGRAAL